MKHKKLANAPRHGAPLAALERAARRQPGAAQPHYDLAEAYRMAGQLDQAVQAYRKVVALVPAYFPAHNNMGVALIGLARFDAAAAALRGALAVEADAVSALINLGIALQKLGQLDEAGASLQRAVAVEPASAVAHYNLGNVLREQGATAEACTSLQAALALDPAYVDAHNSLGLALWDQGNYDAAIPCYLEAIRLDPQCAPAYTNLGNVFFRQGKLTAAIDAFGHASAVDPSYAMAHLNLGSALRDQGQFALAMASYRRALALRPDWLQAQQALLFLISSSSAVASPAYLQEVARFGQMLTRYVAGRAFTAWQPRRDPARLRVGMVSGDLRAHPVAYFLEAVLGWLPDMGIDVILYPTGSQQDAMSTRLQSLCRGWQPLLGLGDAEAARRIHDDAIDILIDLSGHTYNNRLAVFGFRPAPVQASWLGYFATTGVPQIDAILVDPAGVPPGSAAEFTEQPCYLPDTRLCFSPPSDAAAPAPLPAMATGRLTFGCFQHNAKVSDAQLALWKRVLDALPGAVLRWQCLQFADPQCVNETAKRLIDSGIGLDRAQLFCHTSRADYLAAHAQVDIILDTSPYPGGTTTCEALWMGVPTVTLAGGTLLSRQGASLLTAAGLADWVAGSEEDYIARAVTAARDLPGLAILRAGLRQQVAASPLCDGQRFAAHLHAALLDLAGMKMQ